MSISVYTSPLTDEMCDFNNVPYGSVADFNKIIYIKTDKLLETEMASHFLYTHPMTDEICDLNNVPHGSMYDLNKNIYLKTDKKLKIKSRFDKLKYMAKISDELRDFLHLTENIVDLDVITNGIHDYLHENNLKWIAPHIYETDEKIRKLFELNENDEFFFITFNELPQKHYDIVILLADEKKVDIKSLARISKELFDFLNFPWGSDGKNGCIVHFNVITEGIYKYLHDNDLESGVSNVYDTDEKICKLFEIDGSEPLSFFSYNEVPYKHYNLPI